MLATLASFPQLRLLSLLLLLLLLLLLTHVKSDEREILLNLKSSLVNTKNSKLIFNSWNDTNSICSFHGITCNPTASVTEIDLSNRNLSGVLPLQSLCNLQSLEKLVLGFNNFRGRVTEDLRNCVKLQLLDLGNNSFSGPFPDISPLHNLHYLFINNNGFSGTFPWQSLLNMTGLLQLSVGDNPFHLTPFPTQVLSLKKLSGLYLRNCTLGGRIPVGIGNLTELTDLMFAENFITGELPVEIGKLKKLRTLDFCVNSLTGKIPIGLSNLTGLNIFYGSINHLEGDLSELRFLTNLVGIGLSMNNFSGEIPPEFGEFKHLQKLVLYGNRLTGPIPQKIGTSTLCNASSLNVLNLAHNNLTGMIPQCLATLPSLSILDMQMNNFYGSMPRSFSKKNVFETIKLDGNQLEGPLPRSLAHCTKLQVLDVGDNNIEDTFPNWLEALPELHVLSLRFNKLHGGIRCSSIKHPFPKLRTFDVSNNNFSGPLPTSCIKNFQGMMNVNESQIGLKYMGNTSYYNDSMVVIMKGHYVELTRILTTFTTIDLSNNMFEGEIPEVMGELNSLKGLNLSHNGITHTIPRSLSNLRNLEWLDLSWNQLTGEIPVALTNLNFLSFLNLSQNQFEGIIPTGKQFDTFGNESYEGNPMLCGFPLSKSCNNHEDWPPHSTSSHEESGFGWKPVAVGYACGAVFGMLLGYNVFLTGKPRWLTRLVESMFNIRLKRINNRARANRRRMN